MEVDKNREPNLFWLTGSQQFHLMKGVSESLAGRIGTPYRSDFMHSDKCYLKVIVACTN